METVIITGATSMIGIATIEACLKRGVKKIYAVVRENCSKLNRLPKDDRVIVIPCGADAYRSLPEKIQDKCTVFYHFAWSLTGGERNKNLDEQAKNISYTLDAVEAAAAMGCELFVGAGSQAEYGLAEDERPLSPGSPTAPIQAYGIAKYAAGKLAMQKAAALGMHCVWVRVFSVYGKWEKTGTLIQSVIRSLQRGISPALTEGVQLWDYLYSEDAGEAFSLIGEQVRKSCVYCLGSGIARPLRSYIEELRGIISPDTPLRFGAVPYSENSIMCLCADISPLTADTGWAPVTGFRAGIEKTIRSISEENS